MGEEPDGGKVVVNAVTTELRSLRRIGEGFIQEGLSGASFVRTAKYLQGLLLFESAR